MSIIIIIAIITIGQIAIAIMISSNIDDCDRYRRNEQYGISINVIDNIKRKSVIISKLSKLIILLLGIVWGFIIIK
jgi:hypothetical protein